MHFDSLLRRPILATVISLLIILSGIAALFNLPVSQFPEISPPSIAVRAQFPGADAETSARVVAAQIENQLNGVPNLMYMNTSTSSTGGINITLTFEIGTDLNVAINDVLNRIYAAMPLLPAVVQQLGVTARKSSPDQLLTIAFYSDPYIEPKFVSNYLERTVENDLLLLPTVGNIGVFGTGTYALRIWLDPNKMQRYGVGVSDIQTIIKDQNQEFVVGRSNSAPIKDDNNKNLHTNELTISLTGNQMVSTAEELSNLTIRNNGNQIIRIKDIARVELGANAYTTMAEINFRDAAGKFLNYPCTIMQIFLVPGANQLEGKTQVLARLEEDAKSFPYGLHYRIVNDNSRFVAASIHNVVETISIAFILVSLVIYWFLRDWRASCIAICTIPVSIIGTMACLYTLGFSLNTLSLFALVLAIGIVVDDAIVIIENVERLRTEHPNYSLKNVIAITLKEVMSAVIAIVLVLSVVFVPVMALSGLSGAMYRQFAVTIACAVVLSGVSALTFTPALCNLLLKNKSGLGKKTSWFDRAFLKFTNLYVRMAEFVILKHKITLLLWVITVFATLGLFKLVSTGFVPQEDQGIVMASMNLPSSSNLKDTDKVAAKFIERLTQNPNISSVVSVIGLDFLDSGGQKTYAASFFLSLMDWSDRQGKNSDATNIIQQINRLSRNVSGMTMRAFNQPAIRGLSTTGGVEFYVEDRVVGNPHELQKITDTLIKRLKTHKEVGEAYQTLDTNVLQLSIVPNVEMSKFYGVDLQTVYNALQTMYSNNNINYAYIMQDLVWVIMEADYPYRASLDNIRSVYVRNINESMVPIGSVVKTSETKNALVVQRFNNYIASKVVATPAKGYTAGDVMKVITDETAASLTKGYDYDWVGTSYQLKQSQKTSGMAFAASFIMIYLVLAALFEMWRLPLVILMGVPFALFGAILTLLISGTSNDLYFQISLIALLGLSAKNIILLVEFALQYFNAGHSAVDSAIHALRIRFRPIVMTSVTFICGTIPLVFARGAGANAQHSVGIGIIGGVLGSVLLATLLTPSYFVFIMQKYIHKQDLD